MQAGDTRRVRCSLYVMYHVCHILPRARVVYFHCDIPTIHRRTSSLLRQCSLARLHLHAAVSTSTDVAHSAAGSLVPSPDSPVIRTSDALHGRKPRVLAMAASHGARVARRLPPPSLDPHTRQSQRNPARSIPLRVRAARSSHVGPHAATRAEPARAPHQMPLSPSRCSRNTRCASISFHAFAASSRCFSTYGFGSSDSMPANVWFTSRWFASSA